MKIAKKWVARILVDTGSSLDIHCREAFEKMGLGDVTIKSIHTPMFGFAREVVMPMGLVTLPVIARDRMARKTIMIEFVIVDCPGHFNAILGRPFLFKAKAVISMYHLSMKFPVKDEIWKVTGDQAAARKCYVESVKNHDVAVIDPWEPKNEERVKPVEEVEEITIKE